MKTLSIKRNNDFLRIYRRGKSVADSHVICYVSQNRLGKVRLGLTTSKKIGNAVARNRARRVLRAAFREVYPMIKPGYDIILYVDMNDLLPEGGDEIFHILKVHFSHIEWSAIAEQNTCSLCWIEDGHLHHIKFDYVPQESEEYEEE